MKKGFTLVELVIVIVIVGILSIVAVPIYKGYVEKARLTEGKALVSAIRTAQDIYFAEHGAYYTRAVVGYDPVLGIDARGNKYYKTFESGLTSVAGVWGARTYDSVNAGDWISLYWNVDNSAPVTYNGHETPVFRLLIDGETTYTNS